MDTVHFLDLTHSLQDETPVYPGDPRLEIERIHTVERDGFALSQLHLQSHAGTHIDAPAHVLPGAETLDNFPIAFFTGEGFCIDCSETHTITAEFLSSFSIPDTARFILFYSGWSKKWGNDSYFRDYPRIDATAIDFLLGLRPNAVGIDCPSFDAPHADLQNHCRLLGNGILLIENLKNLDGLVGNRFRFYAIPLLFRGADGAPVRAFAEIHSSF